jgi:hypothetical protein
MYLLKTYVNESSYINHILMDSMEKHKYCIEQGDKLLLRGKKVIGKWDGKSQREIYSQIGIVL